MDEKVQKKSDETTEKVIETPEESTESGSAAEVATGKREAETDLPGDVQPSQKKAKPDPISELKKQVEFYFSDSNFPRDKFLRGESEKDPEGWVLLSVILSFRRMTEKGATAESVVQALEGSEIVEISEDKTKLKRKHSIPQVDTSIQRSIRATGFPSETEPGLENITTAFSVFGQVASVRYQRVKESKKFTGNLFVEFKEEDGLKKALAATDFKYQDHDIKIVEKAQYFKEQRLARQKINAERKAKREAKRKREEEESAKIQEEKFHKMATEYTKGLVLKIAGVPPEANRHDIKGVFEEYGLIKFVGHEQGQATATIRYEDTFEVENALKGINGEEKKKILGSEITGSLLEGEEEAQHWKETADAKRAALAKRGNKKGGKFKKRRKK